MLQYDGTNGDQIKKLTKVYAIEVFPHFIYLIINKSYRVKLYVTDYIVPTEFGFKIVPECRIKEEV